MNSSKTGAIRLNQNGSVEVARWSDCADSIHKTFGSWTFVNPLGCGCAPPRAESLWLSDRHRKREALPRAA